ncbi:MAG: ATPase associated with various cellular 5 [Lacunisphaera sp.]|nr:ATPase associated with various cellular 5 [Lacunisphaera sp.]
MDLSWVSYVATANDDSGLPPQLRDRFRIARVPAPGLAHLPALAANVVSEIEREDRVPGLHGRIEDDELDVIGGAWKRQRFSIRALQKMVRATLDARAAYAPRN